MKIVALPVWIMISYLPGIVGSLYTSPNIPTWYATLKLPVFTPPGWFIGTVWTVLYFLMGISAYLIWEKGLGNNAVKFALMIFLVQLVLNGLWSYLFFGQHLISIGLFEIFVLWFFVLWTTVLFFPLSAAAGWLLIPYLLWAGFASVINFSVWLLNR